MLMRGQHRPSAVGLDLPHTRGEARWGLPVASSFGTERHVVLQIGFSHQTNQVETMTNVVGSGGSMGVRASGLGLVAWKDGDLRHLAEEGKCQEAVACIVALK